MRRIFPVIDPALFSQTIQTAYSDRISPAEKYSAQACILAFMAMFSSLYHFDPGYHGAELPPIPRDTYIAHATAFLPAIVQESLNLDALQTAILLAIISTLAGEIQTAVNHTSIASRLLMAVGAHTMSDNIDWNGTSQPTVRQHLRALFWFCYSLDKDLALRTGQPHCLRDEDCITSIPSLYEENFHLCLDYSPASTDTKAGGPIFPCNLRLSKIKSRTYVALYSHKAFQKSDIDILRSIRELDEDLECWRMSLPESHRPQLSFAPKQTKPKNTYLVLTHMNYYCCVNLIHLACSRCSAWRSGPSPLTEMSNGLQSSLSLSVEASRSLLLFLDDSEPRMSAASFCLPFYLMSAVITVFCNLNLPEKPDAESARRDLCLLELAETATGRLFLRRDSALGRASDLKPVTGSISALREHAERAVLAQSLG
ncbi:hypothetical protein N7533_000344 [Penicillium manginii]|uniref:uncharacterized protein n=1 Tax=Penicillium manginii TaxID=203109 RepID=UPI00254942A9|nr:uncharacterized protein N7533_000344 [Penicillium manginii]KAJ5767761.1 hypothetical protein N7533_000344 [Penicillium manginii]